MQSSTVREGVSDHQTAITHQKSANTYLSAVNTCHTTDTSCCHKWEAASHALLQPAVSRGAYRRDIVDGGVLPAVVNTLPICAQLLVVLDCTGGHTIIPWFAARLCHTLRQGPVQRNALSCLIRKRAHTNQNCNGSQDVGIQEDVLRARWATQSVPWLSFVSFIACTANRRHACCVPN